MFKTRVSAEDNVLTCVTCGQIVGRIKSSASVNPKSGMGLEFLRYKQSCPACGGISCDRCAKGRLLCDNCLNRMSNSAYQRIIEHRRGVLIALKNLLWLGFLPCFISLGLWVPLYIFVMSPNLDHEIASTIFMIGNIVVVIWLGWFLFNLSMGAILMPVIFKKIVTTALTRGEQVLDTLLDPALRTPRILYRTLRQVNFQRLINSDVEIYLKELQGVHYV